MILQNWLPIPIILLRTCVIISTVILPLPQAGIVKILYDPVCGTGGMLSIGEQHLCSKDVGMNPDAKLEVFGQEINPESYAICKSDMLIKGQNPTNIKFGNTFTIDGLKNERFDYMLSNPPFLPNEFFGYWRVTVEQPQTDEDGDLITAKGGKPKPDAKLRDYKNIPFLIKNKDNNVIPQTINEYFKREVKPHLPNAWIDEKKTKTSFEINFTKYFYEFKPLCPLAQIKADILALEKSSLELEKTVLED